MAALAIAFILWNLLLINNAPFSFGPTIARVAISFFIKSVAILLGRSLIRRTFLSKVLTKDKVNLRINFWVDYLITDLEKLVTTIGESYYDHLYNLVQMALRSVICDKTLDEILLEKEKISKDILSYLKSYESKYFVSFEDAGIKDIILPGEIKDILNTVLIAEKQAQANVITRREETASTRSLLNTAKLMEENDVLYRLKELEMLERIFDKVGNINVDGGNFIESLENIVGTRRKEK